MGVLKNSYHSFYSLAISILRSPPLPYFLAFSDLCIAHADGVVSSQNRGEGKPGNAPKGVTYITSHDNGFGKYMDIHVYN